MFDLKRWRKIPFIERYVQFVLVVASCLLIVLSALLSAGFTTASQSSAVAAPVIVTEPATPVARYTPTVDLDTVMSSPDYGMQVFLYWREEVADRDLKLVEDAGFRWVKQEIRYSIDVGIRFRRRPPSMPWWARLFMKFMDKKKLAQSARVNGFQLLVPG